MDSTSWRQYYCFCGLLVWILVSIAAYLYWSEENEPMIPEHARLIEQQHMQALRTANHPQLAKADKHCNPPDKLQQGDEGIHPAELELKGVITILRHGDRAPLVQVRDLSGIDCGVRNNNMFKKYLNDVMIAADTWLYRKNYRPFLSVDFVPKDGSCIIGRVTQLGVLQQLLNGQQLNIAYNLNNSLLDKHWDKDDVLLYSTRYQRSFHSALPFLYSFLPEVNLSTIPLGVSNSVTFCFPYCDCPAVSYYNNLSRKKSLKFFQSHPAVQELIRKLSSLLHPDDYESLSPNAVKDSALGYVCHRAALPCRFLSGGKLSCATLENINSILSYLDFEGKQVKRLRESQLLAYGHLLQIRKNIHSMVSSGKPKVVLYSGHDVTLMHIMRSLGMFDSVTVALASRLTFEIYLNKTNNQNVFRAVFNGKDLTRQISVCTKQTKRKIVVPASSSQKFRQVFAVFCPVEALENYLVKDYFLVFNESDFNSACKIKDPRMAL